MATMRVVQVPRSNGPFEIVDRQIPEPGPGSVRIKVQACGVCHSDSVTKEGAFPGIQYPRVPGHEVAGVIDAVAAGVAGWTPGQRVGVGWHGGHCGHCDACRRGEFFACQTGQATGVTFDGAKSVGSEGSFSKVTSIQRVNTVGGVVPKAGCSQAAAGTSARINYAADYYFFTGK